MGGGSGSKRFLLQNNGTHDIEGGTQPRERPGFSIRWVYWHQDSEQHHIINIRFYKNSNFNGHAKN